MTVRALHLATSTALLVSAWWVAPATERSVDGETKYSQNGKIEATIQNARVMWELGREYGSFHAYLRSLPPVKKEVQTYGEAHSD